MKRSVLLFPRFANIRLIEMIRDKYDPLASHVAPHITLVFPFESQIGTEELQHHMMISLHGVQPFNLKLQGVTGHEGRYLFLNIKNGNDAIIDLHDRLYQGILGPFLYRRVTYVPHLTLGLLNSQNKFNKALEELQDFNYEFTTTVNRVHTEIIDDEGYSHVQFFVELSEC